MVVRRLNKLGIETFQAYLESLPGAVPAPPPPVDILEDYAKTDSLPFSVDLEVNAFKNRLVMAEYLDKAFANIDLSPYMADPGFWAWMSLLFFDQVCPLRTDGSRNPGKTHRHIIETSFRVSHRHLLAGPFVVYRLFKADIRQAKILLIQSLDTHGDYYEQLVARQEWITNPAIVESVNTLYLDGLNSRYKRGGQTRNKPGTMRRFLVMLDQFDCTFDLYSMTTQDLLNILPPEFDKWKA